MLSRKNTGLLIAFFLTTILYFYVAFIIERTQFTQLLFLYVSLFATSFYLLKKGKENIKLLTTISVLFRLIFLFSIPNLSQDFYRFIGMGECSLKDLIRIYFYQKILSINKNSQYNKQQNYTPEWAL